MVAVGDTIPNVTLKYAPYDPNRDPQSCPVPVAMDLHKELKGKKVVIFSIPGAFTPTCTETHVPGFLKSADAIKAKGVSEIICVASNDVFVMDAFAQHVKAKDKVVFASDGGSSFYQDLGLTFDLTKMGLGVRGKRFAMIVDDLKVTYIGVEEGGDVSCSGADAVLQKL
ncbi:Redoxin [Backusella circina FSU 941]|nr:Redoxin [Backusella circina FSU 941]